MSTNPRQVSSSVATVIPEMGLDEEPISPVSREETVTKRKPNSTMNKAPTRPSTVKPSPSCGAAAIASTSPMLPKITSVNGRSRSVRGRPRPFSLLAPVDKSPSAPRSERKMSGMACTMLMMPPVATAPAPM